MLPLNNHEFWASRWSPCFAIFCESGMHKTELPGKGKWFTLSLILWREAFHCTVKMNDYKVLSTVGEGAHGIVLKARHIVSGDLVALKKVTLKKISEDGIPVQVIREIKALQCLEHENVVYLIDVFPQGLSFVMVFEFMPSNLWEILDSYKLSGGQAKCYMKMILRGLEYLHRHHVMHRVRT